MQLPKIAGADFNAAATSFGGQTALQAATAGGCSCNGEAKVNVSIFIVGRPLCKRPERSLYLTAQDQVQGLRKHRDIFFFGA